MTETKNELSYYLIKVPNPGAKQNFVKTILDKINLAYNKERGDNRIGKYLHRQDKDSHTFCIEKGRFDEYFADFGSVYTGVYLEEISHKKLLSIPGLSEAINSSI